MCVSEHARIIQLAGVLVVIHLGKSFFTKITMKDMIMFYNVMTLLDWRVTHLTLPDVYTTVCGN